MFKNAYEFFENGLKVQKTDLDKKLFEQQLEDLKKIKIQLKQEFLNSMLNVKINETDKKTTFEIYENGFKVKKEDIKKQFKNFQNTKNESENDKTSSLPIHLKKDTFSNVNLKIKENSHISINEKNLNSFEFLNLRDIEGKVIKHQEEKENEENKANNGKVSFVELENLKSSAGSKTIKGILRYHEKSKTINRNQKNEKEEELDKLD